MYLSTTSTCSVMVVVGPMFESLLTRSFARMENFCLVPMALLSITTRGVLISFSKKWCFTTPSCTSNHASKSKVCNLPLGKSSSLSTVNSISGSIEFITSRQTFPILFKSVSSFLSSSCFHSSLYTSWFSFFSNLTPFLILSFPCLTSST